jgi:uncharacterized protein
MTLAERLGHHPENRRRELERVARILFDEFEDAQKGRLSEKRKGGGILKLFSVAPMRAVTGAGTV